MMPELVINCAWNQPSENSASSIVNIEPRKWKWQIKEQEKLSTEEELYCMCMQPNVNSYLACDQCGEWYHFDCIGIDEVPIDQAHCLHYICQICEEINGSKITGLVRQTIELDNFERLIEDV